MDKEEDREKKNDEIHKDLGKKARKDHGCMNTSCSHCMPSFSGVLYLQLPGKGHDKSFL